MNSTFGKLEKFKSGCIYKPGGGEDRDNGEDSIRGENSFEEAKRGRKGCFSKENCHNDQVVVSDGGSYGGDESRKGLFNKKDRNEKEAERGHYLVKAGQEGLSISGGSHQSSLSNHKQEEKIRENDAGKMAQKFKFL